MYNENMIDQELVDYVEAEINNKITIEEIKNKVLKNGWSEKEFDDTLVYILEEFKKSIESNILGNLTISGSSV